MKKELKEEYNRIVEYIINNDHFLKTKEDIHHGSSKYEHLIRVSKCSFVLGKIFNADINSVTRAAILHDFFFGTRKEKEENSYLNHPHTAAFNARFYFNVTPLEEEAIRTHMYHHVLLKKIIPFLNRKEKAKLKENRPTSKEGWIVCVSDLLVSLFECERFELTYIANLTCLILLNIVFFKH